MRCKGGPRASQIQKAEAGRQEQREKNALVSVFRNHVALLGSVLSDREVGFLQVRFHRAVLGFRLQEPLAPLGPLHGENGLPPPRGASRDDPNRGAPKASACVGVAVRASPPARRKISAPRHAQGRFRNNKSLGPAPLVCVVCVQIRTDRQTKKQKQDLVLRVNAYCNIAHPVEAQSVRAAAGSCQRARKNDKENHHTSRICNKLLELWEIEDS